jgi:hypothetical protein
MSSEPTPAPAWPSALRRYLGASLGLHLVWEVLQLPLYTISAEAPARQAFAVLHCSIGDLMIAGLSILAAIACLGRADWPRTGVRPVWLLLLMFGVAYTVYSEWLNVGVRGSWAYAPAMPTLPLTGTGLAPLLQWVVVPTLVQRVTVGRWPWLGSSS